MRRSARARRAARHRWECGRRHDVRVLGLRLVKLTVNFDDPYAYHFYYGDAQGHPGTILTFFAWPGAPRGHLGTGQLSAVAFTIPQASLDYWSQRLRSGGIQHQGPSTSLGRIGAVAA